MRILVTGANGYVGKPLVEELTSLYGESSIITLNSKNYWLLNSDIEAVNDDYRLFYKLHKINEPEIDVIIHLAVKTAAGDYCQKHTGEQFLINNQINNDILQYWKSVQLLR